MWVLNDCQQLAGQDGVQVDLPVLAESQHLTIRRDADLALSAGVQLLAVVSRHENIGVLTFEIFYCGVENFPCPIFGHSGNLARVSREGETVDPTCMSYK